MSEVRLVIREAGRDCSGTVHGSTADRAIAALGADPVTLAELETAIGRFEKRSPNHPFLANLSDGLDDEPYDAGIVVIDMVARLIVVDSSYSSPGEDGEVCYHDGHCATDKWLRYHLADDWLFSRESLAWHGLAEKRRRERAARPHLDARSAFYGRPLLEFIARETFAAYTRREASGEVEDALRDIHARWLMTPRDDLGGACPRDVALERHNHIGWDLQHQEERWSRVRECPPGLDKSSFAFRYGGFGTHELVNYYYLVRDLLWSCWGRLAELEGASGDRGLPAASAGDLPAVSTGGLPAASAGGLPAASARGSRGGVGGLAALTVGDFLTEEVPRLERVREEWLDAPNPEFSGRTPRSMIDRERARLPEGGCGRDAIVDPDCPCCQMLAEMPGPMFWHLDGCNMDDEFAFNIRHRTREEWEAEQREWEEMNKRFEVERLERRKLGLPEYGGSKENSVWSSSFSVGDAADVPLGIRLFGIGGHLAELITDIRSESGGACEPPHAQQLIDQLNRDFGNVREVLQTSEAEFAEALIDPVITHFTESLATVAATRPDLSAKCEALTESLARFLEPQPPEEPWDDDDSEFPF